MISVVFPIQYTVGELVGYKQSVTTFQLNFLQLQFSLLNAKIIPQKRHDSFLCTSVADPHDNTDIKKIVAWTVTGIVLLIAIIAIVVKRRDLRARWQQVMRGRQNDEERPILGENRGDVVQETRNNFRASTSGGSEEASGSSSVKPSSSGTSILKKDDINTKLKNVTKTVR